ncbi:MAG: glycosyltransferase [Ferruginibacter sp.]
MKIIFVIPSLARGGQEKAGMLLCNFLRNYHDVTVICFENEQPDDFSYLVPVIRLADVKAGSFFSKTIKSFRRISHLRRIKKQQRADISIAFGNTAIIANWLSSVGERQIVSIRQSFKWILEQKGILMKLHLSFYVKALKRAHTIVSVSSHINSELLKFNISNNIVIHNGIDVVDIVNRGSVAVEGMKENKIYISHCGRFDYSKGHWHLVKVFIEIKKKCRNAVLLLLGGIDMSGSGKRIYDFCIACLAFYGFTWSSKISDEADVIFLGHQENPFKFISKSSLFLLTSVWEGFPNALLEAMACAVPVVAADCPTGPAEILKNETGRDFGILLPAFSEKFDPLNFAVSEDEVLAGSRITELLLNSDDASFFSAQSVNRSLQFSIENTGNKWLKVIENGILPKNESYSSFSS